MISYGQQIELCVEVMVVKKKVTIVLQRNAGTYVELRAYLCWQVSDILLSCFGQILQNIFCEDG